ncbi:MAG: hypothetical protein Q4C64_07560 [Erysipelotrichia bacterium]|nr:hypothetical protein [Erysipelotrichia bacterium]
MNKQIIKLIRNEPIKLAHLLGFTDMNELHNNWLKRIMFSDDDFTLLAHRSSYKTSTVSIAIALLMILYPNKVIFFMRKTDTDVIEIVRQVSNILSTDLFREIVEMIYDVELRFTDKSAYKLNTNLNVSNKGAVQLLGLGINGSLTGKHADIIFTDDIVNIKDRISKSEREHTKLIYQELQNIKNRGGRFVNTGTTWHKEDCISLMPNKIYYDCYSTGLINKDTLNAIRQSMTPSLFSANYELKHIADEDALFTNPQFFGDDKLLYNGVLHIDASYGGGDGTAFTIIKQVGNCFYVLGKRRQKHVDDCLSEFYLLMDKYKAGTIYAEQNADKGYLEKEMRMSNKIVKSYNENMNKYIKISTYLRANWSKIYFHEDTDSEYLNEILDYTENAQHDDSPDSLASIIRELTGKGKWLY